MKKKILKFIRNLLLFFFGSSILAVIVLRFIPVYFTPLMFIRTTQQIIHGEDIKWKHSWIPKENISPHLSMAGPLKTIALPSIMVLTSKK